MGDQEPPVVTRGDDEQRGCLPDSGVLRRTLLHLVRRALAMHGLPTGGEARSRTAAQLSLGILGAEGNRTGSRSAARMRGGTAAPPVGALFP